MEHLLLAAVGALVVSIIGFWLVSLVVARLLHLGGKALRVTAAALASGGVSLLTDQPSRDPKTTGLTAPETVTRRSRLVTALATGGVSLLSDGPHETPNS